MNARTVRFVVLFAMLVGVLAVPATASAGSTQRSVVNVNESFASLNAWVQSGQTPTNLSIEAHVNRDTGAKSVQVSVFRNSDFSGSCYVENPNLKIQYALKSASLDVSCQTQNSFDYFPNVYTLDVQVTWTGIGAVDKTHTRDRSKDGGEVTIRDLLGGTKSANVSAVARVNGKTYLQKNKLDGGLAYIRGTITTIRSN